MDPHSRHLHPDEIDVDKATWVAVFAKPGPTIGPTIYIHPIAIFTQSKPVSDWGESLRDFETLVVGTTIAQ